MLMNPDFEPLPPYTDPRSALKAALPALRPAQRMGVTEAAERFMRVNVAGQWQPFRRDVTPYMVEPTDMIASRRYRGLVFCGPSQSGKTQMLQAALAHAITCDPGRVALFQMTRDAAAEFERNKLAPMVRNSPEIRARQASGRGADNLYQKLFTGGTQLTLDWPTITKLSSASIRLVLATDYDHFPESIDGEGDGYTLMRARARSFQSRGMVVVESSPGAPLVDENWRPQTPHDCPPVSYGVLALYPQGTRARWYWCCPACGTLFEPTFRKLFYPDSADPMEAGEAAVMRCPDSDCRHDIPHTLKRDLNSSGRWLHEASDGTLVGIDSPMVRRTDMASYWLDGAAAAFSTWAELVSQFRAAVDRFEATGDEEPLKSAFNTGQAQPYMPRSATSDMEVTVQGLRDKARGNSTAKGVAPSWARYVTVSVDVQGSRFVVGVTAWGLDGRHQPIDRFDLALAPGAAPGQTGRSVRPFDIAEDWDVLVPLAEMSWPVDGTGFALQPVALALDMHGGGSSTAHAYRFYRGRRRAGQGKLWFLTRGEGGSHVSRVWLKAPERSADKRRRVAKDIQILFMSTDSLKDAVASSLRLTDEGQNICLIPEWMEEAELLEFTAERRGVKGWEKRPGMVRNESLDHLVQARALHIQIGAEKITEDRVPVWARLDDQNPRALRLGPGPAVEAAPADAGAQADGAQARTGETSTERAAVRPPRPSRGGWMGRHGRDGRR